MQRRGPAPHVLRLDFQKCHASLGRERLQPAQRLAVDGERAPGDAALDAQVLEVARDVGIEDVIRRNPAQYLWVHKRFKTRPEGEASLYGPRAG